MPLTYQNNLNQLAKLATDVEAFGKKENLDQKIVYALNLCLDELLTNIISYGLKENKQEDPIELELKVQNGDIIASIKDSGVAFNPTKDKSKDVDTSSDVDHRAIGGLGVYFIDQYMDSVQYKREGNKNVLTLKKKK